MKTNSVESFFHRYADTFDSLYDGRRTKAMQWVDRNFRSDMFIRFALTFDLLPDLRDKRVIDIGCGSGPYVIEALKRGASFVTAMDVAPGMLDLARRRVAVTARPDAVQFVQGNFPSECPPGKWDAAIVMGVMDYVEDPVAFLRRVREVADTAVLSFPSRHWFRTPVRKVRYIVRRCPVWFFTEERIGNVMRDAGVTWFEIQKVPGAGMDYVVRLKA